MFDTYRRKTTLRFLPAPPVTGARLFLYMGMPEGVGAVVVNGERIDLADDTRDWSSDLIGATAARIKFNSPADEQEFLDEVPMDVIMEADAMEQRWAQNRGWLDAVHHAGARLP